MGNILLARSTFCTWWMFLCEKYEKVSAFCMFESKIRVGILLLVSPCFALHRWWKSISKYAKSPSLPHAKGILARNLKYVLIFSDECCGLEPVRSVGLIIFLGMKPHLPVILASAPPRTKTRHLFRCQRGKKNALPWDQWEGRTTETWPTLVWNDG